MKMLVVHDTHDASIKRIAHAVAAVFSEHGNARVAHLDQISLFDLSEVSLFAVGISNVGQDIPPALQSWLDNVPEDGLLGRVAITFGTHANNPGEPEAIADKLVVNKLRELGCRVLVPHENFTIESPEGPLAHGEVYRSVEWTRTALDKLAVPLRFGSGYLVARS